VNTVAIKLRKTGISLIGDVPWGTHFCHFYETRQDLLDTLVPYFKAGLESKEFCLWVVSTSDLITVEEAKAALAQAVPDLDQHLSNENIEILNGPDWYLAENVFSLERVTSAWDAKLKRALALGYEGMRVSGDTFWLAEKDWQDFVAYEKQLNRFLTDRPMTVLCTYPLAKSGAVEVLDVVQAHRFAIARRQGEWQVIETPELMHANAEIKRLNEALHRLKGGMPRQPLMLTYGVAVLSVITALIISLWMQMKLGQQSTPIVALFLCAVMFSAWFGGVGPGLLAMIVSLLAFDYYFLNPIYSLAVDVTEIPRLVIYVMAALLVGSVSAAQRSKADSLRHARDVLDGTVQELKRTNVALQTKIAERDRAEDALRRSEDRIRLIIDTIPTMAWSIRPDGVNDFVNKRWLDYTGLSLEEEIAEPTRPMHPEDLPGAIEKWRANMAAGEPSEDEMRLRRADGEYRWFLIRTAPLHDEQGNVVKWYGVSIDIEDRKHAEALLHAKDQEFRAIVENAPDHIARYDREFRRTYVNPALAKAYGLPAETLIGKPMFSIIRDAGLDVKEGELAQIRQRYADVFETGKSHEFEISLPMPPGRKDYSVRLFPELDLNGSVINVLSIARDITESKRAEEELKKEKEILEKIFDNIPVMIALVGDDGRVKLVNPEWERTIGWTLKELQEQNADIFAEAYPDQPYRQQVLDFVAAATGEWVDLKIRVRDGRVIDAACAVVRLSDGTKVAIAQDITERKGAEGRIRATSEQLRSLSARLQSAREEEGTRIAREIHDELGSALTGLKWGLEEMDTILSTSIDQSELAALREKLQALMKLTDMSVSALRRIASELRPSVLDDLGLVAAIEWQAQQFQARTGIICDCSLENVELSEEQSTAVFRIFQETLTNVLRHAQATRVDITLKNEGSYLVLVIRDNGKGITEQEKAEQQSLGILGMRERAHLIGAEIDIKGVEGKGTVVILRVPVAGQDRILKMTR
jgi:PAS domain S-box-containing protein